jgi:hypothetical protein
MTDPRLARLRAAVEKATSTVKRSEVFAESYYRGFGDMRRIVLALLDAEAGEPEPTCPCEQRAAQNNADPTAPPPSDAREGAMSEERLFAAIRGRSRAATITACDVADEDLADAILAAIRDELEPITENLTATATNAREALMQVAVLKAQVAAIRQSQCADADLDHEMDERVAHLTAQVEMHAGAIASLQRVVIGEAVVQASERAAPSGDAAQGMSGGCRCGDPQCDGPGDRCPEPAPASAWPSEAWSDLLTDYRQTRLNGYRHDTAMAGVGRHAKAIERAAEERGARAFASFLDATRESWVGVPYQMRVKRWLSQRAEGTP